MSWMPSKTYLMLCVLFGFMYAFHLEYPKPMKNTLECIQKVILGLGKGKLSPKLQSLKESTDDTHLGTQCCVQQMFKCVSLTILFGLVFAQGQPGNPVH